MIDKLPTFFMGVNTFFIILGATTFFVDSRSQRCNNGRDGLTRYLHWEGVMRVSEAIVSLALKYKNAIFSYAHYRDYCDRKAAESRPGSAQLKSFTIMSEHHTKIKDRRIAGCLHGIRKLAARLEAENERLKAEVLALEKAREKQRRALELAAVRLQILTDRERACHEETGNHELVEVEAQAFADEARAALKESE
jgi:hypothetical protein